MAVPMVKPSIAIVNETGSDLPHCLAGIRQAPVGPMSWKLLTAICRNSGLLCYVRKTAEAVELVISSPRTYYAAA